MRKMNYTLLPSVALVGLFLISIYAPGIKMVTSEQVDWSFEEKRKLARLPAVEMSVESLKRLPSGFEAFFNDHFGFRDDLIRNFNQFVSRWFGKSPVPDVLLGRDGWLYYTQDMLIQDYLGLDPFTEAELEHIKENLEKKRDWLAARGVRYLFVVPPNKQTLYPDYLPEHLQARRGRSRFDQLVPYLEQHSDFEILDLREPLRRARARHRVYHRTDSHWNLRGAYVGGREIRARMQALFPEARFPPLEYRETGTRARKGGDLAVMLKMADTMTEEYPVCNFTDTAVERRPIELRAWDSPLIPFVTESTQGPIRAVVFRDSFAIDLVPVLANQFEKAAWVWRQYDHAVMKELLPRIKPHVVIEEVGERRLIKTKTKVIVFD